MTLWAGHSHGGQEPAGPGEGDQESIQQPQARARIREQSSLCAGPRASTLKVFTAGAAWSELSFSLFQEHFPAVALVSRLCA